MAKSKSKTNKTIHTSLKLPRELYSVLKALADADNRSFHGFLILKLKEIK